MCRDTRTRKPLGFWILLGSTILYRSLAFVPAVGGRESLCRELNWIPLASATSNDNDDPDQAETSNVNPLSDEELLLACRAYLQKKNRLGGWTEAEKRKESRKRQLKLAKGSATGGFFWDDPTELKYFRSNKGQDEEYLIPELDKEDEDLAEDEQLQKTDSSTKNKMSASRLDQVSFEFQDDSDSSRLEQWAKEFSSFPTEPSDTRLRRSRAALRLWDDPEWKAKWYERRWGAHNKQKEKEPSEPESKTNRQKEETRAAALSFDFLASPEFASLSEEEVAQAVAMYTQANAKRGVSRKQALKERKAKLIESSDQPRVPSDALSWDRDPEALKEAKRIRSEKARKAYETRLRNKATNSTAPSSRTISKPFPGGTTPQDALLRIESDLDHGKLPKVQDLEYISSPRKLAKRRNLLRRILLEQFGLRGKCVPTTKDDINKMQFITNCTVKQLMAFVLDKVREKERAGSVDAEPLEDEG